MAAKVDITSISSRDKSKRASERCHLVLPSIETGKEKRRQLVVAAHSLVVEQKSFQPAEKNNRWGLFIIEMTIVIA